MVLVMIVEPGFGGQKFMPELMDKAAAYYYHGMILDEGNTEKSHGMAVAALQAAEEFLKESKKACEAFNSMPPTSRNPPLWGSMKYLSEKIPKDASSKVRINRDLYSHERELLATLSKSMPAELPLPKTRILLKEKTGSRGTLSTAE